MTVSAYAAWPFRSFTARSIDENERWWKDCYLPGEASKILAGWPHWRIIAGGPGSGKSVALAEVARREAGDSLIVRYPLERWPGERLAFSKDAQHLAQIMACVALAVRDYLSDAPDRIMLLHPAKGSYAGCSIDLPAPAPSPAGSMACCLN